MIKNKDLSKEQIHSNIIEFVNKFLSEHDQCINLRNKRPTGCQCLEVFRINEDSLNQLIQALVKYEIKKTDERQLFLHRVFMHTNLRKEKLCRGERKVACNAITSDFNSEGETVHICNDSLQCLLCIGPKTWKRLQNDAILPDTRNTENDEDNLNKTSSCIQRVIGYLFYIFKEEGETQATRIIRMQTKIGLRDKDFTLMHLPLYYSKRRLYERFCFVSGWEVKPASNSLYPPAAELKKRDNDNEDISDERMSL